MRIPFTKMHGAGNDFVVIDARDLALELSADQARHIADRHRGIGCDQILILDPAQDADFAYRIFNAGGGEVQQCGNGARALARFARPHARPAETLRMRSPAGIVTARFEDGGAVAVEMGVPDFSPAALPFRATRPRDEYERRVAGQTVRFGAVSMGNPHAVIEVDDVGRAPVARIGPALEKHPDFPEGVNVGFCATLARDAIALRVWERGAGETQACGTGACAAVAVGRARGRLDARVRVTLPGGELMVNCAQPDEPVWLIGPALRAFEGHIEL